MKTLNHKTIEYIKHGEYPEIGYIMKDVEYEIENNDSDPFWSTATSILVISGQNEVCDALAILDDYTKKDICKAISAYDSDLVTIEDYSINKRGPSTDIKLNVICDGIILRQMLINSSTGKQRIQDINTDFKIKVAEFNHQYHSLNHKSEIPFDDLWSWYKYYKEKFGTYHERRNYIKELFKEIFKNLIVVDISNPEAPPVTGWDAVDRILKKCANQFATAKITEDYQQIGLLCRETFISTASIVYNTEMGNSEDGTVPSKTDSKRMLEIYIENKLNGQSNQTIRKYLRSSIDLSNELQHKRTASKVDAAICLQATISVVKTIMFIEKTV